MFALSRCLLLATTCVALVSFGFGQGTFVPTEDLERLRSQFRTPAQPLEMGGLTPDMIRQAYDEMVATIMEFPADFDSDSFIQEIPLPDLASGEPAPEPESSSGVCAQDLDGQKFRAVGGSAPFGPVPYPGDEPWAMQGIPVVVPATRNAGPNTLVIIDDFDLKGLESELSQWDFNHWMSNASSLQPHGHHVLYHSLRILSDVSLDQMSWLAPVPLGDDDETELQRALLEIPRAEGGQFTIVLIDFSMNVDLIAEAVQLVDMLGTAWPGSSAAPGTIAVNMSWSLVPCRFLADYTAEERDYEEGEAYASYHEYLVDVASDAQSQQMLEVLKAAFNDRGSSVEWTDDLHLFFSYLTIMAASHHMALDATAEAWNEGPLEGVEWLASSGNQGFSFPLPPAVFDHVCAVGATQFSSDGDPLAPASWSNAASAYAPGAWFSFGPSDDPVHEPPYAGTSFASPFAALAYLAHDATQTRDLETCIVGS